MKLNIGGRIKKLRKEFDLTQQKFGEKLGVKGNTIAQYELGRSNPVDSVISLMVREFNVSEDWLRNGTGEMFIERNDEDVLMEWAGKVLGSQPDSFKRRFVKMLSSLTDDEWGLLERKAKELVSEDDI